MNASSSKTSHLTLRNVPIQLARALKTESKRRGQSLNATAIELLSSAAGVKNEPEPNGLESLAGTWKAADARNIAAALKETRRIDKELWK